MPDFIIIHTNNNTHGFTKTNIHIVDENNRREEAQRSSVDGDIAKSNSHEDIRIYL